ncbi:hypothetical protein MJH12_12945, partial [bacterium]|nr:hypothetical protein [bacterium]
TSKDDPSQKWTSLKADAGAVELVGIEGLTVNANTMSVQINLQSQNTKLVDYKDNNLSIITSSSTSMTLDMDGSKGELIQITGNLNLNIFDFFSVSGGFAFVKSSEVVTLADGSQANVDLLTLGGSNVNAFAGLNGGTSDQLGLVLSGVNFGLAIMKDKDRDDRSWLALKGNVGSVSFEGVDGLELAATDFIIDVNKYTGVAGASSSETTTDTSQEVVSTSTEKTTTTTTKTNTILSLNLKDTFGQAVLSYKSDSAAIVITKTDTDLSLKTKILNAFESLDQIAAGNVVVTGSKSAGFEIEFINNLEGKSISDLTVSTIDPSISSTVVETRAATTGQTEVQTLTIAASLTASGRYTLSFDGQSTRTIRFAG